MHCVLAAAGLPVERRNVTALLVDPIGADLVEVGMYRIQKALRPIEVRKEGLAISRSCSCVHAPEAESTR
jgi:hypothetical protein